jgi:hypothetical protein
VVGKPFIWYDFVKLAFLCQPQSLPPKGGFFVPEKSGADEVAAPPAVNP